MQNITEKIEEYMRAFPIQRCFSFDISPYLNVVKFQPGEYIFKAGSKVETLYYLIQGKAKLTITEENGKLFIDLLNAPGFIGEMELLGTRSQAEEVCAYSNCICYAIQLKGCKEDLLTDAIFLRYLATYLSKNSMKVLYHYAQSQTYPLRNRLARFILNMARNNVYSEKHTEAANYLGVSYRQFLNVIAAFCKEEIIVKSSNGYNILDLETLQKVANEINSLSYEENKHSSNHYTTY